MVGKNTTFPAHMAQAIGSNHRSIIIAEGYAFSPYKIDQGLQTPQVQAGITNMIKSWLGGDAITGGISVPALIYRAATQMSDCLGPSGGNYEAYNNLTKQLGSIRFGVGPLAGQTIFANDLMMQAFIGSPFLPNEEGIWSAIKTPALPAVWTHQGPYMDTSTGRRYTIPILRGAGLLTELAKYSIYYLGNMKAQPNPKEEIPTLPQLRELFYDLRSAFYVKPGERQRIPNITSMNLEWNGSGFEMSKRDYTTDIMYNLEHKTLVGSTTSILRGIVSALPNSAAETIYKISAVIFGSPIRSDGKTYTQAAAESLWRIIPIVGDKYKERIGLACQNALTMTAFGSVFFNSSLKIIAAFTTIDNITQIVPVLANSALTIAIAAIGYSIFNAKILGVRDGKKYSIVQGVGGRLGGITVPSDWKIDSGNPEMQIPGKQSLRDRFSKFIS